MPSTRVEHDSMGELNVPSDALYAAQTQRAVENFPISGQSMPEPFIRALILVKAAAAAANKELDQVSPVIGDAIIQVAHKLLADPDLMRHFPVDIYQTGSGTSTNMNANEVIATLASLQAECEVQPNDHVNAGQSSNDVIPTAIHVSAALEIHNQLLPALEHLSHAIKNKASQVDHHVKTGRTHLMDAMPIRMSQSMSAWATQIDQNIEQISFLASGLTKLAQGGTAVGTGINAHPLFSEHFANALSKETGLTFKPADNFFAAISSQDTAVAVSGQLKTLAVSILKIANDLRWMNSGPLAGLGEIELEALQPGSSIMPGKVNPVIPEAAAMVSAQVIGNDTTITIAGQSGNFELNVMLPVIASNLLQSIHLLANTSRLLANKAISTFVVNNENLNEALAKNPILVTALNPIIGYEKAAEIAKLAYKEGRPIIEVAHENTDLPLAKLREILNPLTLTK